MYYGLRAMAITEKSGSYINEDKAWGPYPWDAMAYAYYQLGELAQAHRAGEIALSLAPGDPRLQGNMQFYTKGGGDRDST